MKKSYFFFLLVAVCLQVSAQSICADAQSDVIYAYSHVKTAYNSNNLSHLKQYSKRSAEAFERAKSKLKSCDCESSYNAAYDGYEALSKVLTSETYEDGRFYVKKGKEFAKEAIDELEICTKMSNEDLALAELQQEQFKLKQQQIELKLKEEQIKLKLAEKEEKEVLMKKQQLIDSNEIALQASVDAFNDVLKACGCSSSDIKTTTDKADLTTQSEESIKTYYLNTIKQITSNYLLNLNQCIPR